jgi:hypothetical protein
MKIQTKSKKKKPKLRIPVAPPGQSHKSKKDYDRKLAKESTKKEVDRTTSSDCQ